MLLRPFAALVCITTGYAQPVVWTLPKPTKYKIPEEIQRIVVEVKGWYNDDAEFREQYKAVYQSKAECKVWLLDLVDSWHRDEDGFEHGGEGTAMPGHDPRRRLPLHQGALAAIDLKRSQVVSW